MEGSIRVRNGRYQLIVSCGKDYAGKRQRFFKTLPKGTTKHEAEKELATFYSECMKGDIRKSDGTTVHTICRNYIDSMKPHLKDQTVMGYESCLRTIDKTIGQRPIDEVTRFDVQEWVNSLKLSPKTVKNVYSLMHAACYWAERMNLIMNNPCNFITLPRRKPQEAKSYTKEQIVTLINALDDCEDITIKVTIMFALFCGLRRGEICGLDWSDIDGDTVSISRTRNKITGKGIIEDTPKTVTSVRKISMPKELVTVLEELKKYQNAQKYEFHNDAVIKNKVGNYYWTDLLGQKVSEFEESCGLPRLGLHALRHTHASMMINLTHDPVKVSKRLGHSKPTVTMGIYAHLFSNGDQEIADEISEEFFPPEEEK